MWRAFLATVYTAGLRLNEAMNLTWDDIEFEASRLHVTRKAKGKWVQGWTPKDHCMTVIPLPETTMKLLAALRSVAPEKCPYVFLDHGRWRYFQEQVSAGAWRDGQELANNVLRRFKTMCRRAKVGPFTVHDLRRSCITNWANGLPVHVVRELAGHSDISTTQQFYLSVQASDLSRASEAQQTALGEIPAADLTDPKLTHSARKRRFSGPQGCKPKKKALD